MKFKSISLSAEEIDRLLSIDDAEERSRVRDFISLSMRNPEAIHADEYRDDCPVIYKFARRVERRFKTACRRLERKNKETKPEPIETEEPQQAETVKTVGWGDVPTISCIVTPQYCSQFIGSVTSLADSLRAIRRDFIEYVSFPYYQINSCFKYIDDLLNRVLVLKASIKYETLRNFDSDVMSLKFMGIL